MKNLRVSLLLVNALVLGCRADPLADGQGIEEVHPAAIHEAQSSPDEPGRLFEDALPEDVEDQVSYARSLSAVQLSVPHQHQTGTGCSKNNWCCGIASGNMATAYLNGVAPTDAYLLKEASHLELNACCMAKDGTYGTTVREVADAARAIGNASGSAAACFTFSGIKTNLAAGRPIAVGLMYGKISRSKRCSDFKGKHMVLVVGYNEERHEWTVNDPLCSSGNSVWSSMDFRAATSANSDGCAEAAGVFFAK